MRRRGPFVLACWLACALALPAGGCDERAPRLQEILARVAQLASEARASPCPPDVAALPESAHIEDGDPRLSESSLVVVLKSRRRLALYERGALAEESCFRIGLAERARPGDKRREGDRRTPEGWYRTSDKPWSQFYRAIAIHYPNRRDAARGLAAGRIDPGTARTIRRAFSRGRKPPQRTPLGGEILIHGGGGQRDWTMGCIALDNADLDALRARLPPDLRTWALILP